MSSTRVIELLRIGNPWLVGRNVNRVVPVYVAQNLIAREFEKSGKVQSIKHLAFDASIARENGLAKLIDVKQSEYPEIEETAFGLFAPERRVFRDRKAGGAGKLGALFPIVAGLTETVSADDGLGNRLRELMDRLGTDWRDRLASMFIPDVAHDPATAMAVTLLGGTAGTRKERDIEVAPPLSGLDLACAQFVDNLIDPVSDARRIPAIRSLAAGAYLVSIIRMVAGPTLTPPSPHSPLVLVYGGLPPGDAADLLPRAASDSFQRWVALSWRSTADNLAAQMAAITALPRSSLADKRRQQLSTLLLDRGMKKAHCDAMLDEISQHLESVASNESTWCKEFFETPAVGFRRAELARRVRSLGANIGLVGPDRGFGNPRLIVDTPLLEVLIKGICGGGSMDFRTFVAKLALTFGLVLGTGDDDTIADKIELSSSIGTDTYTLLQQNQELFRERLLRTGLARSYSDSHTEVSVRG